MYTEERMTRIPVRDKTEETECPLPDVYQKACKRIMQSQGWTCEKCWRDISSVIVPLGKIVFVVDHRVKEFDWNSIQKKKSKPKPKAPQDPKDDPFAGW